MDTAVNHVWQQTRRSRKGVANIASAEKPHDVEASTLEVRQSKMDTARLICQTRDPGGFHFPMAEGATNAILRLACDSVPSPQATDSLCPHAVSVSKRRKGAYVHPCLLSVTEDRLNRKTDLLRYDPVRRRSFHSTRGWPVMGSADGVSRIGKLYNRSESNGKAAYRGEGKQSTNLSTNLNRRLCEC